MSIGRSSCRKFHLQLLKANELNLALIAAIPAFLVRVVS